jgi:hypothetical protein
MLSSLRESFCSVVSAFFWWIFAIQSKLFLLILNFKFVAIVLYVSFVMFGRISLLLTHFFCKCCLWFFLRCLNCNVNCDVFFAYWRVYFKRWLSFQSMKGSSSDNPSSFKLNLNITVFSKIPLSKLKIKRSTKTETLINIANSSGWPKLISP